MANTFFLALGFDVGGSLVERDKVDLAKALVARAGKKLILPRGAVVAPSLERAAERREVSSDKVPLDWAVFDIDEITRLDFRARLLQAKTVVWNGPMGVFEHPPFDAGTRAVARRWSRQRAAGPPPWWAAAILRPPWPASHPSSPTSRRAAARRSSSWKASRYREWPRWRTREAAPLCRQLEDASRAG